MKKHRSSVDGEWAIKTENLSKCYKLYEKKMHRLFESVNVFSKKKYHTKFYALRDVSFNIRKGETIGIIGPNGSGKSTLLGIISGIIHQTSGEVQVNGTVASLLELGAGFNPELTGMENILFGGNMRGLSDSELIRKTDAIVSFADIGEYIHQPVKTYSSGMFVRLAFALNIHLEPDILIIDEALSVGDHRFQSKCMNAIRMTMEKGTTILLVSHDLSTVRSLCKKVIYLKEGRLEDIGETADVTTKYLNEMEKASKFPVGLLQSRESEQNTKTEILVNETETWTDTGHFIVSEDFERNVSAFRNGNGEARITHMDITDSKGHPIMHVHNGQVVIFEIHFISYVCRKGIVTVSILDHYKNILTHMNFHYINAKVLDMQAGARYIARYRMRLPFGDGEYSCNAQLWSFVDDDESLAEKLDSVTDGLLFKMYSEKGMKVWARMLIDYELHVSMMNEAVD